MKSLPVYLLFASLCLCVSGRSFLKREPFQSWKAPAETITNYEIVSPVVRYQSDDASSQVHSKQLEVVVDTYVLHLELNEGLFPAHFTSRYYDENNKEIVETGHVNCFYHGWVEGHPDWKLTMSTCHGLQGSFGDLSNTKQYHHLEPLKPYPDSLEVPHAFYLATEFNITDGNCGSNHNHGLGQNISPDISLSEKELAKSRLRRQTNNGFLIVEWLMVNDFRQYQRFDQNLSATVLRNLDLANFVDSVYKVLNIRVVLVDVTTWTSGDQINVVSNSNTLLNNFQDYLRGVSTHRDSAMLITNIDISGSVIGLAFVGTMCSSLSAIGLTQDRSNSAEFVGSTAAHELGHILNMDHDDEVGRSCICSDSNGCIMGSSSSFPPPTEWSDCSRDDLNSGFSRPNPSRRTDRCLFNEPSTTVGDPVCGNGIREGDEICDCGSIDECQNPCCNATSCTLVDSADCGEGLCCENCQFKAYGSTCRAAAGECDLLQYCSGEDAECPDDLHIQNGYSCNNNQSYCFSGTCQSHDAQCQFHWGSGSSMAVEQCYERYNTGNDAFGNCGYSSGDFVACSSDNILCGQLQCASGTYQREVNIGVNLLTGRVRVNGAIQNCLSFSPLNPPTDFMHPGLVLDGSKCGDEKLCFMNQCVDITSLASIQPCPVGSNGETCSGNGACNNLNQCSCDVGFNGNDCQSTFTGPGQTSTSNAGVIAGAVIGTLIGLAVLIVVIVLVVLLCVKLKPEKKYKYTPPTQSKSSTTTSTNITNSYKNSSNYKNIGNGSANSSPSVNVVRPGVSKSSYPAPSHPTSNVVGNSSRNVHAPPRPVARPPPPKSQPQSKPSPPGNTSYRPPQVKPAPPPVSQKPQAAPRTATKPQRQWPPPPSAGSDQVKPVLPPKKQNYPPRY